MAQACIEKYSAGTRVMEVCHPWAHSADITNVPNGSKPEASGFRHETLVQCKMSARVYDKRWCIKPLGVVHVEYLCSHHSCCYYISSAILRIHSDYTEDDLGGYQSCRCEHISEGTKAADVNITVTSTSVYSKILKVSRTERRCTHVTE